MLVTGGAGFIGSHFVHYCQKHYPNRQIVNIDKLTYAGCLKHLDNLPCPEQHHFIQKDITDRLFIDALLREFVIDTIVHFAAETHVDRSIYDPTRFVQTNVLGTLTLLESSRNYWLEEKNWDARYCRFHHISTDEVYGSLERDEPAFTETTPYKPSSPYSASKAASDHLVNAYYRTYSLPTTVTHCSNNYGFFQHAEKFIPTIIHACLNEKTIPVYGNGSNIRDWLYVDDHCRAIDAVIGQGTIGETYNIGGNNELSNLEVVHTICEILAKLRPTYYNYAKLITFVKDRAGHDWRYAVDTTKITEQLAWKPKESFASGIQRLLFDYLEKSQIMAI